MTDTDKKKINIDRFAIVRPVIEISPEKLKSTTQVSYINFVGERLDILSQIPQDMDRYPVAIVAGSYLRYDNDINDIDYKELKNEITDISLGNIRNSVTSVSYNNVLRVMPIQFKIEGILYEIEISDISLSALLKEVSNFKSGVIHDKCVFIPNPTSDLIGNLVIKGGNSHKKFLKYQSVAEKKKRKLKLAELKTGDIYPSFEDPTTYNLIIGTTYRLNYFQIMDGNFNKSRIIKVPIIYTLRYDRTGEKLKQLLKSKDFLYTIISRLGYFSFKRSLYTSKDQKPIKLKNTLSEIVNKDWLKVTKGYHTVSNDLLFCDLFFKTKQDAELFVSGHAATNSTSKEIRRLYNLYLLNTKNIITPSK